MWRVMASRTASAPVSVRHPGGQLRVPHQRVAAHLHAVVLRERDDRVGAAEVEDARLRLDGVPLHLVFGRDLVELRRDRLGIGRVL